jgi:predicted O-methyltransferase YrrM
MKRSFAHITPRYVYDRLGVMLDEKLNLSNPWLTSKSVCLLEELLKPRDVGVEFGSGRSTVWFARRLRHITSIEDSATWFSKVETLLASSNLREKVHYRLFEDEATYSNQTETFPADSIDFCLVDGKARDKCAVGMLSKLKPGGILVIDNVNWFLPNDWSKSPNTRRRKDGAATETWQKFLTLTPDYRRIWTSNGVTDTCIFFKP